MITLYNLIMNFFSGIRAFIGLVMPVFANAADFNNWPKWIKIAVGIALLAASCTLAYYVQIWTGLNNRLLHLNIAYRSFFLVALVLLIVLFSWLAYALWKLLAAESEAAEFPDIEAAWGEALVRLRGSGLSLGDAPLFLVVGRPAAGLDALFLAAGVKDIIRTPSSGDPPLRIYAWPDAIYVTCSSASAWSLFCGEATGETSEASWGSETTDAGAAGKTIGPAGFFAGADPLARAEMDDLLRTSKERDLSPMEQDRLRALAEQLAEVSAPAQKKLTMPEDVQVRYTRRLRYLCKLIRRDRRPWCPINGCVVLVPWATTEADDAVRLASGVLSRDLTAAREVLQMRYPTFSVVCDLEKARGFDEFRTGFPSEMLKSRIGQRLPLIPDVEPEKIPAVLASAVQWIGLCVLPAFILRFLRLHGGDPRQTPGIGPMHNRNLYLLMRAVFDRGPRLAQLLSRGLPPVGGAPPIGGVPMFGGCYLAATGKDGRGQAFVPGFFQKVQDAQGSVSWAPDAQAADARLKRWTLLGYVGIVAFAVVAAAASYAMFAKSKLT